MHIDASQLLDKKVQTFLDSKHLSQDKMCAIKPIYKHFKNVRAEISYDMPAPILLITGPPGTGKSWLIRLIDQLATLIQIDPPIKTTFMGIAAINIGGSTMCTFLDMPTEMNKIPSTRIISWNPDKLADFKAKYNIDHISAIIIDEVSMVKPWMLAYLDGRLKEATQIYNKPFGGIAMIMLGDFDQQPPIGGTSLPNLSMTMLRKQHLAKRGIFNVKQSRKQEVEINSTLSKRGVDLFQQAAHIRLTVQYRCTDDPNHMALLTKMNSGSKISPSDLSLYKQLTKEDLTPEKFLFGTIIVTGNYERHELNAFQSQLWAHHFNTQIIRWKKRINYDKWIGRPATEEKLHEAEKENCFWEYFVPMAPAYLNYNINVEEGLANGTLVRLHSLSMETHEEQEYLNQQLEETLIGETINLPDPPKSINVELYPDFNYDDQPKRNENLRKRNQWQLGSLVRDGSKIIIPISIDHRDKVKPKTESIRAMSSPVYIRASKVPLAGYFPLDLGFCITVPKAQGRTIHRVIASLSEHPIPFLKFSWEQLYVVLSRIRHHDDLRLLLPLNNRNTLTYIANLEKDQSTAHYFAGFQHQTDNDLVYWNADAASRAAGFT